VNTKLLIEGLNKRFGQKKFLAKGDITLFGSIISFDYRWATEILLHGHVIMINVRLDWINSCVYYYRNDSQIITTPLLNAWDGDEITYSDIEWYLKEQLGQPILDFAENYFRLRNPCLSFDFLHNG
jgi:hypothetical protein